MHNTYIVYKKVLKAFILENGREMGIKYISVAKRDFAKSHSFSAGA